MMAKLYPSVAVFFFFLLFAFSSSRTPVGDESVNSLLPTQRSDSEPVTLVELNPESTDFRTGPQESDPTATSDSVPLTLISFRPINRHFPRRPFPLSFRHRCRHGHRYGRDWRPVREVPYGDDMIFSEEPMKPTRPAFRGPRFPFRRDEDQTARPSRHNEHDRRYNLHVVHRHHNQEEHHSPAESFMRSFRKFLNRF